MNIGKKIKFLRKENDITQEKLAIYLNVSCQAVSKWENETAFPDISLIVPIANFFNVTTDELLDRNSENQKSEIVEFYDKASYFSQHGLLKDKIKLWETALEKYPNNYECLMQYAYALSNANHSDLFSNDIDTANKYTTKALEICELILEDCTIDEWRDCATRLLVERCGDKNSTHFNAEKAKKYADNATSLYFCKELLREFAYSSNRDEYLKIKHHNILQFTDLLALGITLLDYEDPKDKILALETSLKIWQSIFYDENYLFYHCRIAQIYGYLAVEYAKCTNKEKVIESLKLAKKHAKLKEEIPDGKHYYTSIFLNKTYHDNYYTGKNYSYSEIDLISNLLGNNVFDFMRETKEFVEFKNTLYN